MFIQKTHSQATWGLPAAPRHLRLLNLLLFALIAGLQCARLLFGSSSGSFFDGKHKENPLRAGDQEHVESGQTEVPKKGPSRSLKSRMKSTLPWAVPGGIACPWVLPPVPRGQWAQVRSTGALIEDRSSLQLRWLPQHSQRHLEKNVPKGS